jgi:signal transduction histidine kinase
VLVGRARALAEGEHSPERVQHHAQRIAEQGVRITGIVEKLLGYARRRPPSRQIVDVRHAAEVVVDLLEHEAARRDIALSLSPALRSTCALADQDQLQQAILNLVRNAFDASPAGTAVAVIVAPTQDEQGREWVEVAVVDHGVGITAENLPQLTEPFFTTRAAQNGTGLGLSVVKSIALGHGGALEFASKAGETRATLRIPRHESQDT